MAQKEQVTGRKQPKADAADEETKKTAEDVAEENEAEASDTVAEEASAEAASGVKKTPEDEAKDAVESKKDQPAKAAETAPKPSRQERKVPTFRIESNHAFTLNTTGQAYRIVKGITELPETLRDHWALQAHKVKILDE